MTDPRFPNRPNHPDFWRMSEIVIEMDRRTEAHPDKFEEIVGEIVDLDSLIYMATQRSLRAATLGRATPTSIMVHGTALWIDAFTVGYKFAKAKG